MQPELEHLLVIQDRDRKIRHIDQEVANIPNQEAEIRDKLREDEETADRIKARLIANEVAMKNLELDIQTRRDSILKLKTQQYETKKNEEFRRMGNEVERYEGEIIKLEDSELELMEKAEEIKAELAEANEEKEESQKMVDEDISNLEKARVNMTKERAELLENRTEYAAKVDEDLLYTYTRLFNGKDGLAVVGLIDGVCNGCHMRVIKSTAAEVRAERAVTHCENCGRILYWWTDEADRVINKYE